MKKLKLATFLIFTLSLSSTLKAQEGIEYAVLEYYPKSIHLKTATIYISINGVDFDEIKLAPSSNKFDELKDHEKGFNPLLSQIAKMSKEGWSVVSFDFEFSDASRAHIAYLSRKKE